MDLSAAAALDRTARLINADVFGGELDDGDIIEGLLTTTVRVAASAAELGSPTGQHALTTLVLQLAMCGIGVDLEVDDVPLLGNQPPLAGDTLRTALVERLTSTTPWVRIDSGDAPAASFRIGRSGAASGTDIVVCGTPTGCTVGPAAAVNPTSWIGDWPIGPIAAGIAAAAEGVRVAARRIGMNTRHPVAALATPGTVVTSLDLGGSPMTEIDVGMTHVISAGAITNASLYVLLRVPRLSGQLVLFDDDNVEGTNFNRYPLVGLHEIGQRKVDGCERLSMPGLTIVGVPRRYGGGETSGAARIVIGADDIAVRWTAQRDAPRWLCVGATSHLFSMVSTHTPNSPCAGCVHDKEDEAPVVIPTISVVSGWAGLVVATELLADAGGGKPEQMTWSFPLGLSGRSGHMVMPTPANPRCPVRCGASRSVRRTA